MKKVVFFLVVAVISTGLLTAQVSRLESANGKEKKVEKTFSNEATMKASPEIKQQVKPEFVRQDGKFVRSSESKPQITAIKRDKDLKSLNLNSMLKEVNKTSKDVATVTFNVIGNPLSEYGYANLGFHMLLDADCEMFNNFWDPFWMTIFENDWTGWCDLYESCEYKIPTNASCDINNPNSMINKKVSIDIQAGNYDIAFVLPFTEGKRPFMANIVAGNVYYESLVGNWPFKAGYEYVFEVEFADEIQVLSDDNIAIKELVLPPASTNLTNQEVIKVVLQNSGNKPINSEIDLSYIVNEGTPITETVAVTLAVGAEMTYTFTTKADFSQGGMYIVEVIANYEPDLMPLNDYKVGYTRKIYPRTLPFIEEFDTEIDLLSNWLQVNKKTGMWGDGDWWMYNDWNSDADSDWDAGFDHYGCLQINAPADFWGPPEPAVPSNDYLISDPMIIPAAGTYNVSFYAAPFGGAKVRLLYGKTNNPDEMKLLESYVISYGMDRWNIYIKNFEIEEAGNYYFAFHSISDIDDGMDFDKVRIAAGVFVGIPDIKFQNVSGPISGCDMDQGVIGATVYNRGSEPINEFTLTYKVNNGSVVSQKFTQTIGVSKSLKVSFNQKFDFSAIATYNIQFTAATENEVNTNNNTAETVIKHFAPVTTLPFTSDMMNDPEAELDWNPAEADAWGFSWVGGYYPAWWNWEDKSIPLISRCYTLAKETYRFSFTYTAGYEGYTDDFYVAVGKSSTDPYSWKKIGEFLNADTGNGIIFDQGFVIFDIAEAGDYSFAFFATRPDGDFCVVGTTVEIAPEHDFFLKSVDVGSFARLTPKYQIEGEKTFIANIQNTGKTATESGTIKMLANSNEILSENFAFTSSGQTIQKTLKPVFESVSEGEFSLKFRASIPSGKIMEKDVYKAVSDSTFAYDNIETGFFDGIGLNLACGMGNIYELQKYDNLTSITIGLYEFDAAAEKDFIFAVYKVSDNYDLGSKIYEKRFARGLGNNDKGTVFPLPLIGLQPGKYFFEVRQLDNVYISIAYDGEWDGDGHVWIYAPQEDYWGTESGFGYLHIRPNFGTYGVGISSESISNAQLTLYPNPSKGILNVTMGETVIDKMTVYNAAGQVIKSVNVNADTYKLNTERLSPGLYFISVQTKSGVVNSKFVVK